MRIIFGVSLFDGTFIFTTFLYSFQIVFKMVEENPRDVGHEMDGLSVFYGDESLPRLYENSRISSDQIPGHKGRLDWVSAT